MNIQDRLMVLFV